MRRAVLVSTLLAGCGGGSDAYVPVPPEGAIRVSDAASLAECPVVAATSEGVVVAWLDHRESAIASNAVGPVGRAGADRWLPSLGGSRCPVFATSDGPDQHALAWSDSGVVTVAFLDPSGELAGPPVRAAGTGGPLGVSLACDGSGFGLVWEDEMKPDGREIDFVRLDDTLHPLAPPATLVPRAEGVEGPALAALPSGFALAWYDGHARAAWIASDGSGLTATVDTAGDGPSAGTDPQIDSFHAPFGLAPTPSGGAVAAWNAGRVEARALLLDEAAAPPPGAQPASVPTGDFRSIAVVASPAGALMAWAPQGEIDVDAPVAVQYARIAPDGSIDAPVESIGGDVEAVALAFDGSDYDLVMAGTDGGVYLRRIPL